MIFSLIGSERSNNPLEEVGFQIAVGSLIIVLMRSEVYPCEVSEVRSVLLL